MKNIITALVLALVSTPSLANSATDQIRSIVEEAASVQADQVDWDKMSHLSAMQQRMLLMALTCAIGSPNIVDLTVTNGVLHNVHVVCK